MARFVFISAFILILHALPRSGLPLPSSVGWMVCIFIIGMLAPPPRALNGSVSMKTCSPRSILTVALTIGFVWITTSLHGATRFTVSGKIHAVTKNSQIALFADKPFYGPPTMPVGVVALWNRAGTLFVVTVPIAIPVTLDGKKAGFGDLKSGQYVVVEYELVVEEAMIIYCAATRVAVHGAPARSQSEKSAKHK